MDAAKKTGFLTGPVHSKKMLAPAVLLPRGMELVDADKKQTKPDLIGNSHMKQILFSVAAATALAISAHAGTYEEKTISAPVTNYGTGAYVGLQGGFNAYQNTRSDFVESKVGGFGGIKAGYVFGTGAIRPALELDGFYNGFTQSAGNIATFRLNSGVFLANGLIRFNLNRLQPYVGAGIGVYTAEGSLQGDFFSGSADHTSWAWQVVAGADYYLTPKISIFAEYKFLNFEDTSSVALTSHVAQQLAGMGVRLHF